jgi:isoleucyl-tRNA synthetase
MRFSWEETQEMQRRLNILWNVFRFPLPYMRADGFDPEETTVEAVENDLELIDEWLLSRLQTVKAEMDEAFEQFEHDKGLNALLDFVVEDVSRFYIQEVRERMWEEENSPSKLAAYATLYRVLEEAVALLAPYAPFISEEIYQHLTGDARHPTVHMCDFPERDPDWQNVGLEDDIAVVRGVEEAGSNARQQAERKLRWPIKRVVVDVTDDETGDLPGTVELRSDLIADRLNARRVEVVDPEEDWGELTYSAEADMSKLGPAFGEDAQEVMQACNEARIAEPSIEALEAAVANELGRGVDLEEDMVEFVRQLPDGVAGTGFEALDGEGVVYVDTTLTEDIESEGYAREVIRRVQEMRKDLELDLEERIRVDLDVDDDRVADLVADHEELIKEEVRADELASVEDGHRKTWDVEGTEMEIAVVPIAEAEA